ncbi:hypothetical protein CF070_01565 [Clostridium botulinum]
MTFGQAKLSEIEISNVTTPKTGAIQFVKKAPRYGRNKKPIDGSCAKIVCEFVDSAFAKVLEKANADVRQLKTNTLDIIGDEQDLLDITKDDLLGVELPLSNAKVMLKWDSNLSSWQGLKLVVNLEDLNDKEGKENG